MTKYIKFCIHGNQVRLLWPPTSRSSGKNLLKKRLVLDGYYEVPQTPSLWKHESRPIQFMLVVDVFCMKYTGDEHFEHLVQALKKTAK